MLADLLLLDDPEDERFMAKVTVLKEQVEHHVEEEKTNLFPKVKKLLSNDELDDLGAQMEALTEKMEGTEARRNVPDETGEAAPLQ